MDDAILDGAHQAIAQHGWSGATLERIAQASGTTRMTLHRRGITRDRLREALAERLERQYREALWPALTAPGTARDRLALALRAHCALVGSNLHVYGPLDPATADAVFHDDTGRGLTRAVFTEPYRRLLDDGRVDGTLVSDDPEETATVLLNLVGHTYQHLRLGHGWEHERAASAVATIAMDGVAAR